MDTEGAEPEFDSQELEADGGPNGGYGAHLNGSQKYQALAREKRPASSSVGLDMDDGTQSPVLLQPGEPWVSTARPANGVAKTLRLANPDGGPGSAMKSSLGLQIVSTINTGTGDVVGDVKILIARGASVNVRDSEKRTPLLAALNNDDLDDDTRISLVLLLLKHWANPDAVDDQGNSPLMVVLQNRNFSEEYKKNIADLMLSHGANPSLANAEGSFPLEVVLLDTSLSKETRRTLVGSLAYHGADMLQRDRNRNPPIWIILLAAHLNDDEKVDLATIVVNGKHGTRIVNSLGPDGDTTLRYVLSGAIKPRPAAAIAELLLSRGVDGEIDGSMAIASVITNPGFSKDTKTAIVRGILDAGAKVYGTVDVKTRLIDLARLANLTSVEAMIAERLSAQVESLFVYDEAATLNEVFRSILDAEVKDPQLATVLGAKAMPREQLAATLSPPIDDDEPTVFLTHLRDQYIERVNAAETETADASVCIGGNILFNIAVPKNTFSTGKIACVVVEFTAPDLTLGEENLIYWYDWIPYMLAIAFGREDVLPSDEEFTEPGTEDLLLSAKRKVASIGTAFKDLSGDAIDSVLGRSEAIRWADEEVKALISDRAVPQSNISPVGAHDLRVYRKVTDDGRHLCLLTFDTSFFGHVEGGLGYLPVIAGSSRKFANHFLVAELQESPFICMFESNYRGMQSLQFEEAESCGDPMKGGTCQTWATFFIEGCIFNSGKPSLTQFILDAYKAKNDDGTETETYSFFNGLFANEEKKCALTRFVRCLALRYLDALETVGTVSEMGAKLRSVLRVMNSGSRGGV